MNVTLEKEDKVRISIVVFIFNENKSINILYNQIKQSLKLYAKQAEIIFIDDDSTDGSSELLYKICEHDQMVCVFKFTSNRGQHKAIEKGFLEARGEIIITMDGDLQNNPLDIPKLITKLDEGFDLVCGWRVNRHDPLRVILKSRIGNYLQRKITKIDLHDMSCSLRAYRRPIVKDLALRHKYELCLIPYILSAKTKAITEVKIEHHKRAFGKSKYGFLRIFFGTIRCYLRLIFKRLIS